MNFRSVIGGKPQTPFAQMFFSITVAALILAVMFWQKQVAGVIVITVIIAVFVWSAIKRLMTLMPYLVRKLFRKSIRILRVVRKVSKLSPAVEALQLFMVVVASVGFLIVVLMKDIRVIGWLTGLITSIAFVASVFDIPAQIGALTKLAWGETLGKAALAAVGALAVIVAGSSAKDLAHLLSGMDPKFFPGFQAFATFVVVPIVYIAIFANILVFWSTFNLLVFVILGVFFSPLSWLIPLRSKSLSSKDILYRLSQGKRPPRDFKPPAISFGLLLFGLRHVGIMVTVASVVSTCTSFAKKYSGGIDNAMKIAMVRLDFRDEVFCDSLNGKVRAAYLDGSELLIAREVEKKVVFSKFECAAKKK